MKLRKKSIKKRLREESFFVCLKFLNASIVSGIGIAPQVLISLPKTGIKILSELTMILGFCGEQKAPPAESFHIKPFI